MSDLDHEGAEALFSDFIDGAISTTDRASLEQHLSGCERCRGELDAFKATMAALQKPTSATTSPEFMDTLREQIRSRSRGRFFGGQRRSYKLEIASLVTLGIALAIYVALRVAQPLLSAP